MLTCWQVYRSAGGYAYPLWQFEKKKRIPTKPIGPLVHFLEADEMAELMQRRMLSIRATPQRRQVDELWFGGYLQCRMWWKTSHIWLWQLEQRSLLTLNRMEKGFMSPSFLVSKQTCPIFWQLLHKMMLVRDVGGVWHLWAQLRLRLWYGLKIAHGVYGTVWAHTAMMGVRYGLFFSLFFVNLSGFLFVCQILSLSLSFSLSLFFKAYKRD